MTLYEWIAFYNKKNPNDPFQPTDGFEFFFVADKGFCEIRLLGDMVILGQLAGDARFFKEKIEEAARKLGIRVGRHTLYTKRNSCLHSTLRLSD